MLIKAEVFYFPFTLILNMIDLGHDWPDNELSNRFPHSDF